MIFSFCEIKYFTHRLASHFATVYGFMCYANTDSCGLFNKPGYAKHSLAKCMKLVREYLISKSAINLQLIFIIANFTAFITAVFKFRDKSS